MLAGCEEDAALFFSQLSTDVAMNTNRWREIAHKLLISSNDIERIELENVSIFERLTKIFDKWHRKDELPFTWETMVDVLRSSIVGENALADQLDQKYCQ